MLDFYLGLDTNRVLIGNFDIHAPTCIEIITRIIKNENFYIPIIRIYCALDVGWQSSCSCKYVNSIVQANGVGTRKLVEVGK